MVTNLLDWIKDYRKNGLPPKPKCKAHKPPIRLDLPCTPNKINGDNDVCSQWEQHDPPSSFFHTATS